MNGRDLTLGLVAGLAVAGAVRQRGGRNHLPTLYHVTTRDAADDILRNGFLPGWGDIGLGVYFYGSEREAMRYAQKGGWDGALRGESVVVLAVQDPHIRRMGDADLDPSWDRSKYADMWFWEGRDEDAYMVPSRVSVASDLGVVVPKGARKGSASLNNRGSVNGETLRNELLPAALRDTHDLVVTDTQRRTQLWEPTGVGSGVRPVSYRYHTLVATLYPRGRRGKDDRLGQVAATSERKGETPTPLRGRCADDLVRLNGPAYTFGVTGAFVDEALRGKGVGQALYAALVEAAGAHGGALTSNRCLTGTELTSADALRVWERLGRRYRVEGEVAWQPKGSAARSLTPFDQSKARRQRRVGGELKMEVLPLGDALRKAMLDYASTLGQFHLESPDDPEELDRAYHWRATAKTLARGLPVKDTAVYLHWIESKQEGAGRALQGVLEDYAQREGARWLVAVSVRVDWRAGWKDHGSPLGFYERMGWRVLHVDEGEDPEETAVILKGPL